MFVKKAMYAGVLGAMVMTVVMAIARGLGMAVNLEMMLGALITESVTTGTWVLGLCIHVVAGAVFGLVYAAVFEYVTHRAGWGLGLGIGAVHTLVSGVVLGALPMVHPLMPGFLDPPGMFMANLGVLGVAAFAALHLIFGALVGASYEPISQAHRRPPHGMVAQP
ncbi:MAG: hypothetical protein ACQEXJ_05610 [Myxococcota bacterium]